MSIVFATGITNLGPCEALFRRLASSPSVVAPIIAVFFLLFPPQVFGQLLPRATDPYHLLRYEDVPADQQSPAWPNDFWAPIKFIPLDITPGSYITSAASCGSAWSTSAIRFSISRYERHHL